MSRALAKMSLVEEDCNGNLDDLTKHQLDVLQDWETKFQEKYEVVGQVTLSTSLLHLRNMRCCCISIVTPLTKLLRQMARILLILPFSSSADFC